MRTRTRVLPLALVLFMTLVVGCGEEGSGPTGPPSQSPPAGPTAVGPIGDGAWLNPALVWRPTASANDSTTYDIRLGTSNPPPIVATGISDTTYTASPLMPGVVYFWSVTEHNSATSLASITYTFTTRTTLAGYPMTVGNSWEYRHVMEIDGESIQSVSHAYHVVTVSRVDSSWVHQPAYELSAIWADFSGQRFDTSNTYYYAADSGLYLLGYDGTGGPRPAAASAPERCHFGGREYESIHRLLADLRAHAPRAAKAPGELIVVDPPLEALSLPLGIDTAWTYRETDPWPLDMRVDGYEIVTLPAGDFGCFVVSWLYDRDIDGVYDDDITLVDYYAEQGLVKRTLFVKDVAFSNPETPDIVFYADVTDVYELVSYDKD